MKENYEEIIGNLYSLLKGYSDVKRANINCFRASEIGVSPTNYEVGDIRIHENLMEHIGSLPILASFFHPYIDEKVNLGRVLEMLSIHDIGEIITGDENCFTKQDNTQEKQEALKLIHSSQHKLYEEFDELETNEAKYAKTIDKIAPDIYDVFTHPKITQKRLKAYANIEVHEIVNKIKEKKSPYMEWSTFFKNFHQNLMEDLDNKIKTEL